MTDNFLQFLIAPHFTGWLLVLKIFFIVLSALLAIGTLVFLKKSSWLRRLLLEDMSDVLTHKQYGVKNIEKVWSKIMARLNTGLESEYKLAIIEASSLMDDTLQKMGYKGDSLGEKLKNVPPLVLPNIKDIEEAHRIHGNIVHDPDYRLSLEEARNNLAVYEKTFQDLQLF
ncbi:MAG: hypothetical protein Q7S82_03350 [bacterium]|nr:hypothetical protein [bacterium]